jgi:hypothetical protein
MKNRKILDLYSDYLISSFNLTTSTGLSDLLDGALSHDQISRFLGQRTFSQMDYWKCVKPIVRRFEHPNGVIKIDDTIEEKPHTTENEIVAWHWDHSRKPKAGLVKGINILNFQYQSPLLFDDSKDQIGKGENISIPVAFEIVKKTESWFDKKSGKVKRRSPITKNTMVRERLRILHHMNKLQFRYVLWDTWFSSKENFDFVHYELQKYFVAAVKGNRKIALNCPEGNLSRKYYRVDELDFQKASTITVWLKGMDFPVQICRQVFKNKDGSTGELYLITNDLKLSFQDITTTYEERWGVEMLHKSLKQNVGLEKSPTKNEVTQSNHVFAAMIAWMKLELLRLKEGSNHFALKAKLYTKALEAAYLELQRLKIYQPRLNDIPIQIIPRLG